MQVLIFTYMVAWRVFTETVTLGQQKWTNAIHQVRTHHILGSVQL